MTVSVIVLKFIVCVALQKSTMENYVVDAGLQEEL